ncbi:hypothetical protein EYF80_008265 [Liparis tanakae]|uniref:Uncharacterized protein n=1 Tax=Liparis tanakae TaxID=230148 RepID=A0A4Z2IW82_9TELE|nr:hypothetical protein EYF80_008265 [Liparis tanakae]
MAGGATRPVIGQRGVGSEQQEAKYGKRSTVRTGPLDDLYSAPNFSLTCGLMSKKPSSKAVTIMRASSWPRVGNSRVWALRRSSSSSPPTSRGLKGWAALRGYPWTSRADSISSVNGPDEHTDRLHGVEASAVVRPEDPILEFAAVVDAFQTEPVFPVYVAKAALSQRKIKRKLHMHKPCQAEWNTGYPRLPAAMYSISFSQGFDERVYTAWMGLSASSGRIRYMPLVMWPASCAARQSLKGPGGREQEREAGGCHLWGTHLSESPFPGQSLGYCPSGSHW